MAIYDLHTRRLLRKGFQGQHDQVGDLEFSPDGSLLAVPAKGEVSRTLPIWDVQGAKVRQELSWGHNQSLAGAAFSTDGRTLVTLSVDQDAKTLGVGTNAFLTRWEVATGRRLKGPVRISSNGGDVLLTSRDGASLVVVNGAEVLMEAADTFKRLRRFPHRASAQPRLFAAALSPHDGRTLALWADDGPIELLDLISGRRPPVGRDEGGAWSMQFSPDGTTLATGGGSLASIGGGGSGNVKIWDVASGQLRETFQGHEARVAGLRFSPDSQTLYAAGSRSVIAWDVEGSSRLGRPYAIFTGPIPPGFSADFSSPHALAISSDGAVLAAPWPARQTMSRCSTFAPRDRPVGHWRQE